MTIFTLGSRSTPSSIGCFECTTTTSASEYWAIIHPFCKERLFENDLFWTLINRLSPSTQSWLWQFSSHGFNTTNTSLVVPKTLVILRSSEPRVQHSEPPSPNLPESQHIQTTDLSQWDHRHTRRFLFSTQTDPNFLWAMLQTNDAKQWIEHCTIRNDDFNSVTHFSSMLLKARFKRGSSEYTSIQVVVFGNRTNDGQQIVLVDPRRSKEMKWSGRSTSFTNIGTLD